MISKIHEGHVHTTLPGVTDTAGAVTFCGGGGGGGGEGLWCMKLRIQIFLHGSLAGLPALALPVGSDTVDNVDCDETDVRRVPLPLLEGASSTSMSPSMSNSSSVSDGIAWLCCCWILGLCTSGDVDTISMSSPDSRMVPFSFVSPRATILCREDARE